MDIERLIGWNVQRLRKDRRLSQEELALRIETVAQSYVSFLEGGKRNPTAVTLYLIAKSLNVSVGDLFDEGGAPDSIAKGPVVIRSSRSGKKRI
ncbi:helix-turn-helix transcriptional regulator [Asticcacaulis sp.]|uniref:helix-turn-helix domain-containing protein n=1 Tax=Asticcacaulis sp. TaxID=1872648 RepID=UPI002BA0F0E0|nr:helix-turn-helix transcriptional regulator [Asticcacaulis sp.]HTM82202.1 helix-turn-helix transcriptional regulator [Asticcacaulis sp.]